RTLYLFIYFSVVDEVQSLLICSQQPFIALAGDDVILPCHLEPATNTRFWKVVWTKPDLDPKYIHVHQAGLNISDTGQYWCLLPPILTEVPVQLIVGSVSTPVMEVISNISGTLDLQCESKGWYPEPELLWLDAEGKILSAGPTETVRGPDDLHTVSSRVTVEKRHSNNITCRVQQRNINQTRETQIHVPSGNVSEK
uniref:Ig-like domain-containing protein n=1 Tax=Anabas testudineus TaxID=64144 RepID=A0A3Q1H597_ANATE